MTNQTNPFLHFLSRVLCKNASTRYLDDDAAPAHEALHGDSAVIRLVRELRALEMQQANDASL